MRFDRDYTMATHRLRIRALTILAGASATLAGAPALAGGGGGGGGDSEAPPEYVQIPGTVRDFKETTASGGHPDFEVRPDHGFALYCGNISPVLGQNKKPRFTGEGFKVTQQWTDRQGRPLCYTLFDEDRGDIRGVKGAADTAAIQSVQSFDHWFRDVPGVNLGAPLTLTLHRQHDGSYVFDDKTDEKYSSLGGFFPIEDDLFGNPGGAPDRNFHFTFEMHTEFVYDADEEQMFQFIGDDDVWVFIDDQLVIDLGGVHGAKDQYVDLNRLDLTDGETYELHFFFAERHRTQSNFRIQTTLVLKPTEVPTVSAAFD